MQTIINLFYLYADYKGVKIENITRVENGILIELNPNITFKDYFNFCSGINAPFETTYKKGVIKILVHTTA